jgi:uncharacterized RDD family membrane protein YckC
MACPRCGTDCHCPPRDTSASAHIAVLIDPDHYDPSEEIFSATLSTPAKTEPAVAAAPADAQFYRAPDPEPQWRSEVTSRVSNFRSRRRRPGASAHASMRFDFDVREAASPLVAATELASLPRLEPEVAKIIAFPKALPEPQAAALVEEILPSEPRIVEAHAEAVVSEPMVDDGEVVVEWDHPLDAHAFAAPMAEPLADPVIDETVNQVLEADPNMELPMITPLADIAFDAPAVEPIEEKTFDLLEDDVAFSLAPVFDRTVAGFIDAAVANVSTLLFMAMFTLIGRPGMGKLSLLALSSVVGVFTWTLYQYIFLVHRGQTLGMQFAQLEIRTFEGEPAWRSERRRRVWGLALSCASMGLGFVWALIDEDRLGWHDRITQTCLVRNDRA